MILDEAVDTTARRYPSADVSKNNESLIADSVCKEGSRVFIHAVTPLTGVAVLQLIESDSGGTLDNAYFVGGASAPSKIVDGVMENGMSAMLLAGATAGATVLISYTMV